VHLPRAIGVLGISCVLSLGCAASGNYTPETYVVRPQDTLYSIAWRYDLDYRELARWNNIGPEYRISVGQVLKLRQPPSGSRTARSGPTAASSTPHNVPRVGPPQPLPKAAAAASGGASMTKAGTGPGTLAHWVWPTHSASAPRAVPGGGVLLLGEVGQTVCAASKGRVVYIGSGLRGYGNLIIIKHGDTLLSAYAHNREALVQEGQEVSGGQEIARMGLGPHQVAALYFEIRRNGKPVDPLPYFSNAK
jgi:lipoprotein NlpD